jgi:hypothetical protein
LRQAIHSQSIQDILQKDIDKDVEEQLLTETRDILNYLKEPYPNILPQKSPSTTPEEYIAAYTRVKEKTSSSYSRRHVRHYKAVLTNKFLVGIHSSMMSIPYQAGFSPSRWHHIADVMLEKDPDHPKQHRLRIIALLESDVTASPSSMTSEPFTRR